MSRPAPPVHRWFVAGTDTGVGKTVVAEALLQLAARRGLATVGLKPVAAGADTTQDGRPANSDAATLRAAATIRLPYDDVNPVLLASPIAPHIAAADEGVAIDVAELAARLRSAWSRGADAVVVEGAGGWLVPLNRCETLADLCVALELPVILVVGLRLGCLNHALLTAAAIAAAGLPLAGWVANAIDPDMARATENCTALRERLQAPLLGQIPLLSAAQPAAAHIDAGMLFDD